MLTLHSDGVYNVTRFLPYFDCFSLFIACKDLHTQSTDAFWVHKEKRTMFASLDNIEFSSYEWCIGFATEKKMAITCSEIICEQIVMQTYYSKDFSTVKLLFENATASQRNLDLMQYFFDNPLLQCAGILGYMAKYNCVPFRSIKYDVLKYNILIPEKRRNEIAKYLKEYQVVLASGFDCGIDSLKLNMGIFKKKNVSFYFDNMEDVSIKFFRFLLEKELCTKKQIETLIYTQEKCILKWLARNNHKSVRKHPKAFYGYIRYLNNHDTVNTVLSTMREDEIPSNICSQIIDIRNMKFLIESFNNLTFSMGNMNYPAAFIQWVTKGNHKFHVVNYECKDIRAIMRTLDWLSVNYRSFKIKFRCSFYGYLWNKVAKMGPKNQVAAYLIQNGCLPTIEVAKNTVKYEEKFLIRHGQDKTKNHFDIIYNNLSAKTRKKFFTN